MDEENQVEEAEIEEDEEVDEEVPKSPRDPNYFYRWEERATYQTQQELRAAQSDACEPGEHDWRSTFAFGVDDCFLCGARREVR